jgi:hypothetical protein
MKCAGKNFRQPFRAVGKYDDMAGRDGFEPATGGLNEE